MIAAGKRPDPGHPPLPQNEPTRALAASSGHVQYTTTSRSRGIVPAALGTKRHGELHRGIHGISHKMLTQTLRKLERERLVRRTVYPVVPPRVDYSLTRLGTTLTGPLRTLYQWTERHLQAIERARRAADTQESPPS